MKEHTDPRRRCSAQQSRPGCKGRRLGNQVVSEKEEAEFCCLRVKCPGLGKANSRCVALSVLKGLGSAILTAAVGENRRTMANDGAILVERRRDCEEEVARIAVRDGICNFEGGLMSFVWDSGPEVGSRRISPGHTPVVLQE